MHNIIIIWISVLSRTHECTRSRIRWTLSFWLATWQLLLVMHPSHDKRKWRPGCFQNHDKISVINSKIGWSAIMPGSVGRIGPQIYAQQISPTSWAWGMVIPLDIRFCLWTLSEFPLIDVCTVSYILFWPSISWEAWSVVEANQHRALASYAMMRLQRNRGVRWARCCLKKGMHVLHVVGLYVHI